MYTRVSNVWESNAKTPEEAKSLERKAQIMITLREIIHNKGWNQAETANQLAISQPRVSYLTNGQVSKFSMDKLFELLDKAGYDFQLRMKDGIPTFETQNVA
jgi:predicted XRE-type DNA-binding protein